MNIGIDIDNVISNFNEILLDEYKKHDKEINNKGIVHPDLYIRKMFDWSEQEETTFYLNNIEAFASKFTPIKDAKEVIDKLRLNGHKIYIITGRANGEYSNPIKMTKDWLNKYNIKYDELILTNAYKHHEKADICLENNIDIMIDDSIHVCEECLNKSIKCLLFNTPYNITENRFERVDSWKEIYNKIMNYNKINVILDTDIGNECDDQFALAYLLKNQNRLNIDAITLAPYSHSKFNITPEYSQELSYCEAIKVCQLSNYDYQNKIFKGSNDYIQNGYNKSNDAVNKIITTALNNNKTYILAIGAITNISLAIKMEPKIIDKIEVIWLGGNEVGYKDNLEYNFKQDIEAVKILFKSHVKLTILPCKDVVSDLIIDINTLKSNLDNSSNLSNYLINKFYNDGYHGIKESRVIWDIAVISYIINENWFEVKEINCPNINDDTSYKLTNNKYQINFVTKINSQEIYNDLFNKLNIL